MFIRDFLNKIRKPISIPLSKKILYSSFIFLAGILLGIVSKALDETASNLLPTFLEFLDLRNFFSRMGIWIFFGMLISIYSKTSLRAALNVFLFFTGMVSSYYLYTVTIAGFFPTTYMMIWIAMTWVSPFMAAVCWYAKASRIISVCISAFIFMFMARQAFSFGFWYLHIRYGLELILYIITLFVLYQSPKQIIKVIAVGLLLFFATSPMRLFWGIF